MLGNNVENEITLTRGKEDTTEMNAAKVKKI